MHPLLRSFKRFAAIDVCWLPRWALWNSRGSLGLCILASRCDKSCTDAVASEQQPHRRIKIEIPAFLQGDVKKGRNPNAAFFPFPAGLEPRWGQVSLLPGVSSSQSLPTLQPEGVLKHADLNMLLKASNLSSDKIKPKFSRVAFEGDQNTLPPNMPLWNKDYCECKAAENQQM